jgi:glucoamylase
MLPEQVWDEPDLPGASLHLGRPAGSAVPLVWAHAEYLKLLRSAMDGKVFDRIDPVYARYCEPEGRGKLRKNLKVYSRLRPIQKIAAGDTLRILDENEFELIWSADGWQTTHKTPSRSLGSAGYSADIQVATDPQNGKISWTFHWLDPDRWLGHNVELTIDASEPAL